MKTTLIYWPVLAQLAIPMWVLMLNGRRKRVDRSAGKLNPNAPIDNTAWSLPVVLTSNALANQFQLPVVFYILCLLLADIGAVSTFSLVLCWIFVTSRWVHAFVHVTSNYIPARFISFLFGVLALIALFISTVLSLARV